MKVYRLHFCDPLNPSAPLDHFDFPHLYDAAEASQLMVGAVAVEIIETEHEDSAAA